MDISASMPGLTRLSVSHCPRVLDMGVAAVGQRCHHIEVLDVSQCPKVSEASMVGLLQREGSRVSRVIALGTDIDPAMLAKAVGSANLARLVQTG